MIELLLEAERALSVGMLDQAERLYRQVVAADAHNAIALVGLARIAIERGDEESALALGEQALAIDRDNGAARRLVDRLNEVRAHRGVGAYIPPRQDAGPPSARPPTTEPRAPHVEAPTPEPPPTPRSGFLRRILGRR